MTTGLSERRPGAAGAGSTRPRAGGTAALDVAILLATSPGDDGGPAALLPWEDTTILARLAEQATSVGTSAVHVLTRPDWAAAVERALGGAATVEASADPSSDLATIARIARQGSGPLLVAQGEVVTQREALAGLALDPRGHTGVLGTVGRFGRPFAPRVRTARGRVVSCASPYHAVHRPTATFLGVVKVGAANREELADAAERLAELTTAPLPPGWEDELERKVGIWRVVHARAAWRQEMDAEPLTDGEAEDERDPAEAAGPEDLELPADPAAIALPAEDEAEIAGRQRVAANDVTAMLVTALVRSGTQVGISHLRKLFWARPITAPEVDRAAEAIRGYDEDRVLLDSSVKAADGFFTSFFVSPYSKYIARWAAHRGLTPNQITTASVLIGVVAAAAFATGERWGLVVGAILLQLSFTTDCVDGQLARYTRQFSKLGAWLDSVFDRTKEYAVFAGLAIGYAASHTDDVWVLAGATLTLQTVRHMADFSFGAARQDVIGAARQPPLEHTGDRFGERAAAAAAAGVAPARAVEPAPPNAADGDPDAVDAPRRMPLNRRLLALWRRLDRWPGLIWIKRMAAFPIGERFAVISITAALWDARVTFVVLIAWGLFATAYTGAGRVLRSVGR